MPNDDLQKQIDELKYMLNNHKHQGFDQTKELSTGASYYIGWVNSDGTAGSLFPNNWSSSRTSTGNYTITHTLPNANYVVMAIVSDGTTGVMPMTTLNVSSVTFRILFFDTSQVATNVNFAFAVFT